MTLQVYGSGFDSASQVTVNGAARTTALVSASEVTTQLTVSDLSTVGSLTIGVTTPAPGGGSSARSRSRSTRQYRRSTRSLRIIAHPVERHYSYRQRQRLRQRVGGQLERQCAYNDLCLRDADHGGDQCLRHRQLRRVPVTVTNPVAVGGATPTRFRSRLTRLTRRSVRSLRTTVDPAEQHSPSPSTAAASSAGRSLTGTAAPAPLPMSLRRRSRGDPAPTWPTPDVPGHRHEPGRGWRIDIQRDRIRCQRSGDLQPVPGLVGSGATSLLLTVNGSNFVNGSTISYNGTSRTTTFVSSTQLTTTLTSADMATVGMYPVSVTNPGAPRPLQSSSASFRRPRRSSRWRLPTASTASERRSR